MPATIRIDGAAAQLSGTPGPPASYLRDCLAFLHPARFYNQAFKEGRWDGYVRLNDGAKFPAGFARRVKGHLEEKGYPTRVVARDGGAVDDSRLDDGYLNGIKLWPHQMAAIRAMLRYSRGCLKEPTGSGKTAMMAATARYLWEEKGWRSLVVVPKKGLAVQTRRAFEQFYNDEVTVGIAGDGQREEGPIVIATAQTLIRFQDRFEKPKGKPRRKIPGDEWLQELIAETDVLFLDECHRTRSDSWQEIAKACPAARRYGLSGTPLTEEELDDIKLEGATGPLIHETTAQETIGAGLSAAPKIVMVMSEHASGPELEKVVQRKVDRRNGVVRKKMVSPDYRDAYTRGIVQNDAHNRSVVNAARWMIDRDRKVLILCRLKEHFIRLSELLEEARIEFAALWGATATDEREAAKLAFKDGEVDCILATTIFDEGEDLSGVGGIVLAEGVKAVTTNLQRIGRGMRRDTSDVWIVDFVPTCNETLSEHALLRCEDYEKAGYDVLIVEDWPRGHLSKIPKDLLPFETWDAEFAAAESA